MLIAKLFKNGRSQAVRLPAEFRFEGDEVFIERDLETGNVILSSKPKDWNDFVELVKSTHVDEKFLSAKDRKQNDLTRDPFDDWQE